MAEEVQAEVLFILQPQSEEQEELELLIQPDEDQVPPESGS